MGDEIITFMTWPTKTCVCWPAYKISSNEKRNRSTWRTNKTRRRRRHKKGELQLYWKWSTSGMEENLLTLCMFRVHLKGSDPCSFLVCQEAPNTFCVSRMYLQRATFYKQCYLGVWHIPKNIIILILNNVISSCAL